MNTHARVKDNGSKSVARSRSRQRKVDRVLGYESDVSFHRFVVVWQSRRTIYPRDTSFPS